MATQVLYKLWAVVIANETRDDDENRARLVVFIAEASLVATQVLYKLWAVVTA